MKRFHDNFVLASILVNQYFLQRIKIVTKTYTKLYAEFYFLKIFFKTLVQFI